MLDFPVQRHFFGGKHSQHLHLTLTLHEINHTHACTCILVYIITVHFLVWYYLMVILICRPQNKTTEHLATIEAIYYFLKDMQQLLTDR